MTRFRQTSIPFFCDERESESRYDGFCGGGNAGTQGGAGERLGFGVLGLSAQPGCSCG